MRERPLLVTLVGWIFCILGLVSVLDVLWLIFSKANSRLAAMEVAQISGFMQIGVVVINAFSTFICGTFVLKGANWARWVYPFCFLSMIIVVQVTSDNKFNMAPTLITQAALTLFLFLPTANDYFRVNYPKLPATNGREA
jgi:hypothetical protein